MLLGRSDVDTGRCVRATHHRYSRRVNQTAGDVTMLRPAHGGGVACASRVRNGRQGTSSPNQHPALLSTSTSRRDKMVISALSHSLATCHHQRHRRKHPNVILHPSPDTLLSEGVLKIEPKPPDKCLRRGGSPPHQRQSADGTKGMSAGGRT